MYGDDMYDSDIYDFTVEELLKLLDDRLCADEKAQLQIGNSTVTVVKSVSPNVTIHGRVFDQWRPRKR